MRSTSKAGHYSEMAMVFGFFVATHAATLVQKQWLTALLLILAGAVQFFYLWVLRREVSAPDREAV